MDNITNINMLKDIVKNFCEDRDWDQFHNAKDLAIGIITESSELLEHFRFKTISEIEGMFNNTEKKREISEEISDVLFFILRFAQMYDLDLTSGLKRKITINASKYPIEKFKGSNKSFKEV